MEVMISEDLRSQVHIALRALADQAGFHRLDIAFGSELAEAQHLFLAEVVVAVRLLSRYRRQVAALGITLPDEETAIRWAAEQEEFISEEVMAVALELVDVLDIASALPSADPPQSDASEEGEKGEKKQTVAKRVYVQDDRIFIEFPFDRSKVNAMQPLKELVEDWAFNRYKRQEWSFPVEAASTMYQVTRGFNGFLYTLDAVQHIKRAARKEALEFQTQELEERWQELSQYAALEAAQPYLDGAPTANGQRLFRHQREAVQRMIEAQRFILAHQMGLGKSKSALIAAQAYDLPIWVIAPAGTIINWQREAAAAGVEITLYSWAKLPEPPEHLDYVLIADECFPYNTQIVTDQGIFPIGEIVEKALPVSVLSYNFEKKHMEWKPITRYINRTLQGHLVRVVHEHGSFICTPNHKIWTEEHGYIEAETLSRGACLRILPESIYGEEGWQGHSQILQQALCQYPQSQSSRRTGTLQAAHQACTGSSSRQQTPRCFTAYEAKQSNEQSRNAGKNAPEASWQNLPCSWRERRTYQTTATACTSIDITYRIPNTYGTSQRSVPFSAPLLQGRYSQLGAPDSHRSRWQDSSRETLEVSGQAQNRGLECSRVVRIEVYKPESADGAGPGSNGNPAVYNLEVLDNHNYIADGVLVSNCHYAQGGEQTQRGQGFLSLAAQARAVFMLSGTPIKNALPINLWPLLVAAKHPLAADRSAYEKQYCGAYFKSLGRKRTVYDTSGASNLDELHERTKDVILYRKKSECVDLPDKLRMPRVAEVSKAGETAYHKTIERLRQEHLERMADKYEALRVGRDDLLGEGTQESDLGEFESEYASALVELGIYRHAASLAKVESAVEIAQEAQEQNQGVLLFTAFRDTAERLATKLDADCLTGEVTKARRQAMIDRFQAEESKVLVATIGAGGIGINLTAAQVVIMVDRAWTPGDTEQAEDRTHRLGQIHNVTSIWLQYGPTDDKIDQLLELKQERIETILRGRGKNLRGIPSIRALAKEIMESVHTGKSLAEILGLDPAEFEHKAVDLVRDEVLPASRSASSGGKRDRRLKGDVPRIRANVRLDPEVLAFLRSMKASKQETTKESGYSGFLEELVRGTPQFAAWRARYRQS